MGIRRKRWFGSVLLLACLAVPLLVRGQAAPAVPEDRVHGPGKELEEAVVATTRAFLHDDTKAARKALDRIRALHVEMFPEAKETFGEGIVSYNRAYLATVDKARELATRGDVDESFNQFVWIQRTCRTCHQVARDEGRLK